MNKNICLHLPADFYPIQPSNTQILCFDFEKQNSALPYSSLRTLAKTICIKITISIDMK